MEVVVDEVKVEVVVVAAGLLVRRRVPGADDDDVFGGVFNSIVLKAKQQ